MMSGFDVDLFVIGAGSGGVRAARMAAGFGAKVCVAENYRVGGTCVIRGCVPKKLLVFASHYAEDITDARGFGWSIEGAKFSWPALIANKDGEIARLSGIYTDLLHQSGVTLVNGTARLVDRHTVAVDGKTVTAAHILIASGSRPYRPPIPGIEHAITSDEAFELKELPKRILVVGGGYIAVEFAGIFHGLGAHVALAYRSGQLLRGFDEDVRQHVGAELAKKGIHVMLHANLSGLEKQSDGSICALGLPGGDVVFDAVMHATGRHPNTAGLGLAELGVELDDKGGIVVDRYSHTNVPGIHAVGDVTNRVALTPVAIREAAALATTLFGGARVPFDHRDIPSAVFCQPPVACVGLTQHEAIAEFGNIDVYKTSFRPLRHTLSGRDERSLMKLIVDSASQRVLGAHMVGADAPEIIQGIAIAVKAGLTKMQFDETVGIHPTAAEEFVTLREKTVLRQIAAA
jgi:glutathione reductase (NADPH)